MKNDLVKSPPRRLHQTDYESVRQFMIRYPDLFANTPDWLYENWHIFVAFYSRTYSIILKGRTHYSARAIGEVMRYESILSDTDKVFKICNSAFPDLARAFVVLNTNYWDFWSYNRDGIAFKNALKEFCK